ncbi:hypothetical protein J6590_032684 [Homalodisca vitripennis]|nr:hypothetical protein J6590_032684 [Homalodisca vitripennis]
MELQYTIIFLTVLSQYLDFFLFQQWSRSGGGRWSGDVTLNMKLRYALIFLTALAIVTYHHVQKEFFGPRLETMVIYEKTIEEAVGLSGRVRHTILNRYIEMFIIPRQNEENRMIYLKNQCRGYKQRQVCSISIGTGSLYPEQTGEENKPVSWKGVQPVGLGRGVPHHSGALYVTCGHALRQENYYANERDPEVSCQFPILHPFDESILPHVKIAKPIRCFARNKILTMIDEEGYLKYNKSGLVEGGYDIDSPPSCYFQTNCDKQSQFPSSSIIISQTVSTEKTQSFLVASWRGLSQLGQRKKVRLEIAVTCQELREVNLVMPPFDPWLNLLDESEEIFRAPKSDFDVIYSNPTLMKGCDQLQSDFVFVECYNFAGISIYQNFHASVQRNQSVRKFKNDVELSVAVIGLDSMSRLNFMRQLPLSYRYITDVMEGVVLLGFNKVGENTFPNLVPMLTGRASAWGAYYHYETKEGAGHMFTAAEVLVQLQN